MAVKAALPRTAMAAMHTAGIYSDMTVDGPEIGDLVIIVDKAKNLPNRKTMGKQDPYCAARLGKEAKKTETDKRGGQTPRWDQELRFTVHDSPDYYQLKISVFNDDKKTDLIGECWIDLSKVVVRGGGRSDGWHSLHCKGKYAGEIRIELTYYDLRPKAEKPGEASDVPGRAAIEQATLSGPRQPKQAKRRPLPSNPTAESYDHDQSAAYAPMSSSRGRSVPAEYVPEPSQEDLHQAQRIAQYRSRASMIREPSIESELPYQYHEPASGPINMAPAASSYDQDTYDASHTQMYDYTMRDLQQNAYDPRAQFERYIPRQQSFTDDPYRVDGSQPHHPVSHFSRDGSREIDAGPAHVAPIAYRGLPAPTARWDFSGAPLAGESEWQQSQHRSMQPTLEDETPPPPPTHRNSDSARSRGSLQDTDRFEVYDPSISPAPLNVMGRHRSVSPIPYTSTQTLSQRHSYVPSTSPTSMHSYLQSAAEPSISRASYLEPRRGSGDALIMQSVGEGSAALPPSLIAGHVSQRRSTAVGRGSRDIRHSYVESSTADPGSSLNARTIYPRHSIPGSMAEQQPSLPIMRSVENAARPGHRQSMPIVRPRAISPSVRIPMRKSVSPQPSFRSEENISTGTMPFSPDAYDAFNPNAGVPSTGIPYTTNPEGMHDLQYQTSSRAYRQDGPIIGLDGREIDPADHLPTDTWAPEPLRKSPLPARAETRSRPSPQGAQPMPPSNRRGPRQATPLANSSPAYINNNDPHTHQGTSRNRLQKKSRSPTSNSPSTAIGSSPLAVYDSINHNTPGSLPRTSTSTYPLRERENFGQSRSPLDHSYGAGNGTRSSPLGPPIPTKVPIKSGRDDFSALSEELKSIDIGVGSGGRRGARRRGEY